MGRRAQRCLADPHADAGEGELHEVAGQTGQGGHRTPDDDADDHDVSPAASVGPACDRNPGRRVEECEGEARQQAHRRVGDLEILLDRLEEDGEDLPIDVIDHVEQDEQREHGAGARRTRRRRVSIARHFSSTLISR